MEPIIQSQRGTEARMAALSAFWAKHANSQTYAEYPATAKKALAEELSSVVEGSLNGSIVPPQELSMGLRVLRVLSREDIHMQSLHNTNAVKWTMKLGGLMEDESAPIADEMVIEESGKCLVNIVVKAESLLEEFVKLRGPWRCLELLRETLTKLQEWNGTSNETTELEIIESNKVIGDAEGKYDGLLVPVVRLLFSATRPLEGNKALLVALRDAHLLQIVAEYLFLYSFAFQKDPSLAAKLHLQDLIRIVINLTVDLGALGSSDLAALATYIPRFPRLIHAMHRFFEIPSPVFQDPIYQIHLLAASCFVNVPSQVAGALIMQEDGTFPDSTVIIPLLNKICKTLCNVLMESIKLDRPRACVPLMMWIGNFATGVQPARQVFLQLMFPNRNLDEESNTNESPGVAPPGYDADTVGNAIIGHMCSIEMAVKHWSNELMYIIVGEDADKFVRLTGFGNAAGHLVNRGLFGLGGLANAKTTRADVEAMTGRPLGQAPAAGATSRAKAPEFPTYVPSTPSTGQLNPSQATSSASGAGEDSEDEETMDEEERKAMRIMKKLHELEAKGLVKLVRKGDPQPEGVTMPLNPPKDHEEDGDNAQEPVEKD
jgi:hypothetical protein